MTFRITCLIPCRNECMNIRPCIESIREFADEILVADSGSTDGTIEIARDVGGRKCRVIEREYRWSGDFKNWAIPQAAHDWVLLIDADERIPADLAEEVMDTIRNPRAMDGYWIFRRNFHMGQRLRFGGLQTDSCLRLFRRDLAQYMGDTDHAEIQIATGRISRLRAKMNHYSFWNHNQWLAKMQRYSELQACCWNDNGRTAGVVDLLMRFPLRFLRHYVYQLGFLDGKIGIQYAIHQAYYSFMKQARLWELQNALPQPDPESTAASTIRCSSKADITEKVDHA